ncbi:putative gamma-butyrobetaine hydroxylase subfamily [Thermoascus aurantiacus ATCC 26904]
MSRPLGLLLRRSRGVLPSIAPCRRLYSVGQTQTTTAPADASSNASTSTSQQGENPLIRRVPQADPQTRQRRAPLQPPSVDLEFENGVQPTISLTPRSFRIGLPRAGDKVLYREYDFVHLRDCCTCPQCVDEHSKQRNFRTSDIPMDIVPSSMKWDGNQLVVRWKNDVRGFDESHVSTYSKYILRSPAPYSVGTSRQARARYLWNAKTMKEQQHWISYNDYMNDDEKFAKAMRHLASMGLIFVKDIPDSREMVEKIATRMGPLRNSFYGSTWDVKSVPEAKNVAYTDKHLGFHMDLLYTNEPPGFQLLHCLKNSCEGGESLFVDGFLAATYMRMHFPQYFETLQNFKFNYEYVHEDQVYHNSWPVFETQPSRDGRPPQIVRVNYSPPFQGPLRSRGSRDWSFEFRRAIRALRRFARYLEAPSAAFELKLNPGECAIFENRRVLHARKAFDTSTGERWLAGAYVDEDAVLSTFGVLRHKMPDAWYGAFNEAGEAEAEERLDEGAAEPATEEAKEEKTA